MKWDRQAYFPRLETMGWHSCPASRQYEHGLSSVRSHLTRRKLHDLQATLHLVLTVGIVDWLILDSVDDVDCFHQVR